MTNVLSYILSLDKGCSSKSVSMSDTIYGSTLLLHSEISVNRGAVVNSSVKHKWMDDESSVKFPFLQWSLVGFEHSVCELTGSCLTSKLDF